MAIAEARVQLTPRQLQVIALVRRGLSNSEIAGELAITEDGVKAHLSRLYLRFGVANRVALLAAIDDSGRTLATSTLGELREISGRGHDRSHQMSEQRPSAVVDRLAAARSALTSVDAALDLVRELPAETTGPVLEAVRKRIATAVAALDEVNSTLATTA